MIVALAQLALESLAFVWSLLYYFKLDLYAFVFFFYVIFKKIFFPLLNLVFALQVSFH